MKWIRLNVAIRNKGLISRRKADLLIKQGRVSVNGRILPLGEKIRENVNIHIDNISCTESTPTQTYLFHKPPNILCTRSDEKNRKTIFQLHTLKNLPQSVQSVGRLDRKSQGLMLLTNNGHLAFTLTHPKHNIQKTYKILSKRPVTEHDIMQLTQGIYLRDGLAKATSVKKGLVHQTASFFGQWVEITIQIGRNRIIRRMCQAINLPIACLIRTRIGQIFLPKDLPPGGTRSLTEQQTGWVRTLL